MALSVLLNVLTTAKGTFGQSLASLSVMFVYIKNIITNSVLGFCLYLFVFLSTVKYGYKDTHLVFDINMNMFLTVRGLDTIMAAVELRSSDMRQWKN